MIGIDDILSEGFIGNDVGMGQKIDELEEVGFGTKQSITTIKCTTESDEDYDYAELEGCNRTIEVSDANLEEGIVICDCGRIIDLSEKTKTKRYTFDSDYDGLRNWLRSKIKEACDQASVRKNSLSYLGYRFEGKILRVKIDELRDGDHMQEKIDVHLCVSNIPEPILKTIKMYGKKSFFILIGDGVGSAKKFEDYGLPYVEFGQLYEADNSARSDQVWSLINRACTVDALTDIDRRAAIAAELYQHHRTETDGIAAINGDVFEYIVDSLLNYCFKTSELFGTSESGLEFPDGILALQLDGTAEVYLWDAKYSKPHKEPHSLKAATQRNMAKYPRQIRENSGMVEPDHPVDQFSGFIFVSPRIDSTDVFGFAKKLHDQYQNESYMSGAPVIHIRVDALIALYKRTRDNTYNAQKMLGTVRQAFHNLLQEDAYHDPKSEFVELHDQDSESEELDDRILPRSEETTVFDVTESDIDYILDTHIKGRSTPQTELDYEHLRSIAHELNR